MIRSMTGFGRGEVNSSDGIHVVVEVKTVNHRFLDVAFRTPRGVSSMEDRLRPLVQAKLERGRAEISVSIEEVAERQREVKINRGLAEGYHKAIRELQAGLGLAGEIPLDLVLRLPEVVSVADKPVDDEVIFNLTAEALRLALDGLVAMREREGARLSTDLRERLAVIRSLTREIAERSPEVVTEYRARLTQRIQELLGEAVVDPGRLATEVAIFADRSAIDEELVRLDSHLVEAAAILGSDDGSVGRKLEFLLQEMNREINTIGSKANDVVIARRVIDAKAELEKIREQLQNIE